MAALGFFMSVLFTAAALNVQSTFFVMRAIDIHDNS